MLVLLGGCRLCGNNLEIFRGRQKADSWSLLIRLMLQVWFILPSLPAPQMDQNPTHSEQSGSKMGLRRDNMPAPRIILSCFLEWLYHQNIPHPSLLWNTTSMLKSREEDQTTQIASFKCMQEVRIRWIDKGRSFVGSGWRFQRCLHSVHIAQSAHCTVHSGRAWACLEHPVDTKAPVWLLKRWVEEELVLSIQSMPWSRTQW